MRPIARALLLLCRLLQLTLLALVRAYKRCLSPLLPPACRFHPTCSAYAEQALIKHGPIKGSALAAKRLLRCHPLHEGGVDPVP